MSPLLKSASTAGPQQPNLLVEPPVFTSRAGVLDLLMVARQNTLPILGLSKAVGWVYEICPRPSRNATSCPPGSSTSSAYGGSRLALQPGDTLKIRLVNSLPPAPEAKHAADVDPLLAYNPTNLHTHGLIVEPRYPSVSRPTWGDNIFVVGFNAANLPAALPLQKGPHAHAATTLQPIEYEIDIPKNHPSGLFWFHPHVHGIALNQVSAGLAGIITIGEARDYACDDGACASRWSPANIRHLVLKDTQIESDSTQSTQQDPQFCPEQPAAGEGARQGGCAGQVVDPETDHTGGRWFFTVNGQVYPTIPVAQQNGEIWRITSASGSASYDLHLWNAAEGRDMPFQVIAIDGVSITAATGAQLAQMQAAGSTKLKLVACGTPATLAADTSAAEAICASSVRMMPSSRVELRIAYRDAAGRAVVPPKNAKAVLRTVGFETGGDNWPATDLADVQFKVSTFSPGRPGFATVRGQAAALSSAGGIFAGRSASSGPAAQNQNCKKPLAPGHRRRIYYGVPPAPPEDGFGLGYEEIDENGIPVPGTFADVAPFDIGTTIVCLPLGPGSTPIKETWELVNVSGEDHNFHIHQTKFRIVDDAPALVRTASARASNPLPFPKGTVLHDNTPLPAITDGSCDGTVAAWRAGTCQAKPVVVEIAFSQVGDFVYHCHILEHEDGGMMAKISVIANN